MIDAAPSLRSAIPGIDVDAAVSRQAVEGVGVLRSSSRLGRTIVFHLGTNGTFSADELSQVLDIAAGRRVVVLTSYCSHCGWIASNNAMIKANCTGARHCVVADWAALAGAHPAWFGSDGVHMAIGGAGAQAYARLVASRL